VACLDEREILPPVRKASIPVDGHREIYRVLQIPADVMKPVKTWTTSR
jgi:hypothetical protein